MAELTDLLFKLEFVKDDSVPHLGKLEQADKGKYIVKANSEYCAPRRGDEPMIKSVIENFILKYLSIIKQRHTNEKPDLEEQQERNAVLYCLGELISIYWKGNSITASYNKSLCKEYIDNQGTISYATVKKDLSRALG